MADYLYHASSPLTAPPTAADMPRLVLTDAIHRHLQQQEYATVNLLLAALSDTAPEHARQLSRLLPDAAC